MSLRFTGDSDANASELLDNVDEMFPLYYIDSEVQRIHHKKG